MRRPKTYSRPGYRSTEDKRLALARVALSDAEWDILHAERVAERRRLNGGHQ